MIIKGTCPCCGKHLSLTRCFSKYAIWQTKQEWKVRCVNRRCKVKRLRRGVVGSTKEYAHQLFCEIAIISQIRPTAFPFKPTKRKTWDFWTPDLEEVYPDLTKDPS